MNAEHEAYEAESQSIVAAARCKTKFLVEYIRYPNGVRRGVIVASMVNGELHLGWSLYNTKKEPHRFSPAQAVRKALGRLRNVDDIDFELNYNSNDKDTYAGIPQTCKHPMLRMGERARRYFKFDGPVVQHTKMPDGVHPAAI